MRIYLSIILIALSLSGFSQDKVKSYFTISCDDSEKRSFISMVIDNQTFEYFILKIVRDTSEIARDSIYSEPPIIPGLFPGTAWILLKDFKNTAQKKLAKELFNKYRLHTVHLVSSCEVLNISYNPKFPTPAEQKKLATGFKTYYLKDFFR